MRLVAAVVALVASIVAIVLWMFWPPTSPSADGQDWTAAWVSDPPVVETTPGGLLEVATLRMTEDFYKSDRLTWWGIYLGETVSQVQVAATYRYGVPLSDPAWTIVTRGLVTVVVAPELQPSLPVAIDTATLREHTQNGWARFDKEVNLQELRRSVSETLAARASDPTRAVLVREAGRRTIAEFVEQWLIGRSEWTSDVFSSVKVYFAGETSGTIHDQLRAAGGAG